MVASPAHGQQASAPTVHIRARVTAGADVRPIGYDVAVGQEVLPAGAPVLVALFQVEKSGCGCNACRLKARLRMVSGGATPNKFDMAGGMPNTCQPSCAAPMPRSPEQSRI